MGFLKEFKEFAVKGNVMDMAVGVIIGGAFGKIVTSVVNDIIMPPIGLLVGGVDFSDMKLTMKQQVLDAAGEVVSPAVTWNYGAFIQQVVDFTILAFCVFILVKLINSLNKQKEVCGLIIPFIRVCDGEAKFFKKGHPMCIEI